MLQNHQKRAFNNYHNYPDITKKSETIRIISGNYPRNILNICIPFTDNHRIFCKKKKGKY